MKWSRRFGPGLLVTAAFIGPGTITTATQAGAAYGLSLLWVLAFAVLATVVLQEMAARLGLVTRSGLGEALRSTFSAPVFRLFAGVLIVAAIGFGNAAFQAGNITGAAMGLEVLTGVARPVWAVLVGVAACVILGAGSYRSLERSLIALVALMSVIFLVTAVLARPDVDALAKGLLTPALPDGSLLTVIALIGTTVVPYNLFLHAGAVCSKWPPDDPLRSRLRAARVDTVVSVVLGGAITVAIVITASVFCGAGASIVSADDMARQLEPLLGSYAQRFFAIGLLAAGLSSAVTAPLAAAYATNGVLGWSPDLQSRRFRFVWFAIILIGTLFSALSGSSPTVTIIFAQAANGLILPVIAVALLIAVNRRKLLGAHVNGVAANALGAAVVLIVIGLGAYKLIAALR